jgi:ribonuclease D
VDQASPEIFSRILDGAEKLFGVDSEFQKMDSNFEPQQVAILQVADSQTVWIFDCITMARCPTFIDFIQRFFNDPKIAKIGHTFTSDIGVLNKTFGAEIKYQNIVNLDKMVLISGSNAMGLARMSQQILGKKMCKYNQRSNWSQRPLRQAQLHYGALDAVCSLALYHKISKGDLPPNLTQVDHLEEDLEDIEHVIQTLDK